MKNSQFSKSNKNTGQILEIGLLEMWPSKEKTRGDIYRKTRENKY